MKKTPLAPAVLLLLALLAFAAGSCSPTSGLQHAGQSQLAPEKGSLEFIVLSDWGRDGITDSTGKTPGQLKVARQLAATAREIHPAFVVTCGDNFHGRGVASADDPLWQVNFENVYPDPALQIPWYIALGNHDYAGNVEAELQHARTSSRWTQPGRYYAFMKETPDSSTALFLILDSPPFVQEYYREPGDPHHVRGQDTSAQLHWLDSTLSVSHARWKLAFFHHPVYSSASKHGSTVELQHAFQPLFEKYHVDACFSGHDHDLQHSHPEGSTVEYFGMGGGSQNLPARQAPFTRFSAGSLGFGVVTMSRKDVKVNFVNENGEQLYSYDIIK